MKRVVFGVFTALFVAASGLASAQTAWTVDSAHSAAQFSVKHMMVSTVRGELGKVSGTVQFDGKDVKTIVADITIDATGINTREPKRDEHLKSPDFFDVAKFPTMTFKSKRSEPGAAGRFKLVGDLTMRGVTKEVVLDVEGPSAVLKTDRGSRVGAAATTKINRKDFGVSWSAALDGGGLVVGDEVNVTIDIELTAK